jgi:hypothetical protein
LSASSAGAVKTLVESLGLGLAAYRDAPPEDTALPYVTVVEAIALTPDDSGDDGEGATCRELVQVDLWQKWRNDDKSLAESYSLADGLARGLHGGALNTAPTRAYGVRVQSVVRLVERDQNTVHHAITVEITRVL